jgi:hypothetical protein
MTYQPLYMRKFETGLVQNRVETILPDDAYPILENAYIFREEIKRRQGLQFLGRLRRVLVDLSLGLSGASPWSFNIYSTLVPPIVPQATATIEPGSIEIVVGAITLMDTGLGTLVTSPVSGVSGTINYITGNVVITGAGAGDATTISFNYFLGLPVMGIRTKELTSVNIQDTIAFDTVYAYIYANGWQEYIPGTTWTGNDANFFWSTNYWVAANNEKVFWVTNFSGTTGDPIRYTNGTEWIDFAPQIDAVGTLLTQCLAMLPFRGRLLVFNTLEGATLGTSISYQNRIRWAAIGTPFTTVSSIVTTVNPIAWRDDIRGKGGYLDIPTTESITAVGFVRDNLVIYCERSTWQLRYTGRSIAPFQIEKVNSELGAESTFSAVQFDTSLVGIGDKGVVECDSYKSQRIDIKIPDLVFEFRNTLGGLDRVQGIRDIQQRLAYWTYVYNPGTPVTYKFPNRRLVYNYENDSWAIFTDSITAMGTFQNIESSSWETSEQSWASSNFPWVNIPALFPEIIGGNQQGYTFRLSSNLQPKVSNDETLMIYDITGNSPDPTTINSPDHNLLDGQVIEIIDIPLSDPFASLNGVIFSIVVIDEDNFDLYIFNPETQKFSTPQVNVPGTYIGGGQIKVRDNFNITSKKFNFLEKGENIQMGYLDILLDSTEEGSISLYVYIDYNNDTPVNILPQNQDLDTQQPDSFFNVNIPTTHQGGISSSKNWQRVFCPAWGNFITLQWTLSNVQLNSEAQNSDVRIAGQILWIRPAGKQLVNVG